MCQDNVRLPLTDSPGFARQPQDHRTTKRTFRQEPKEHKFQQVTFQLCLYQVNIDTTPVAWQNLNPSGAFEVTFPACHNSSPTNTTQYPSLALPTILHDSRLALGKLPPYHGSTRQPNYLTYASGEAASICMYGKSPTVITYKLFDKHSTPCLHWAVKALIIYDAQQRNRHS